MKILFAHQYFPGQFDRLARHLAASGDHQLKAFSTLNKDGRDSAWIDGIDMIPFGEEVAADRPEGHVLGSTDSFIRHAASLALAAERLKESGWSPDLVYVHTGWGVGAFLHDVFPDAEYIKYCEWFYKNAGSDADFFDQHRPVEEKIITSLLNLPTLAEFARADALIAPTQWQREQFPAPFKEHMEIVPDGVDMQVFAPDPSAVFQLPDGKKLTVADKIITYVARGADPYRGFSQFIEALQELQRRDPEVQALIAGDRRVYYGEGADSEDHFHAVMDQARLDPHRTHFLGRIDKLTYVRLLQVSSAHVYFTVPFVLSWSMLEAMSTGCLLIGSDTPPVTEFVSDRQNGLLCPFFDVERLAVLMQEALTRQTDLDALRQHARKTIAARWSLEIAIAAHRDVIERLIGEDRSF